METYEKIKSGKFLKLVEERKVLESEISVLREQVFSSIPESLRVWREKEFNVVWDRLAEQGSIVRLYEKEDANRYGFSSLEVAEHLFGELAEAWNGLVRVDITELHEKGTIAVHFMAW